MKKNPVVYPDIAARAYAAEDNMNALGIEGEVWIDRGRVNIPIAALEALIAAAKKEA